jgi:hypothetical protein
MQRAVAKKEKAPTKGRGALFYAGHITKKL